MANQTKKPMEITPEKLDRLKRMSAEKPGLQTHPHNVGAFAIQPLDENKSRSQSLLAMQQQTQMQLNQINEQVQSLTKQALKLQKRFQVSQQIYTAKMSFKPIIGQRYYLYENLSEKLFLSMISPDEWDHNYRFISAVELLADHTWRVLDDDLIS
ncbi:MAG: DUF2452 domain-containing protein [Oligoflexales bacterium]